jgi:chromosome segregation ATPase
MKIKIAIIILIVACAALAIALFATKKQGDEQHTADVTSINSFSNQVVEANDHMKELNQANLALNNDLTQVRQQSTEISNSLVQVSTTLEETRVSLATAQTQITNLNDQVTTLEARNNALNARAVQLTNDIAQLNELIEITKAKLARSEKNNAYLQEALQKQMALKAELEHKFNDINEVRAQIQKLKEEIFSARRAQLNKNDTTSGKKGAELLRMFSTPAPTVTTPRRAVASDLNVEVGSDGSIKVIPPLGATNAPAR